MKKRKIVALVLAALIPATMLIGCGSNNNAKDSEKTVATESGKVKDKIVYALTSSPTGVFNPLISDTSYDESVIALTYSSLLEFDENLNPEPGLAESYEISKDNLSITFKLRDNLKWHDGEAITADDVIFTFTTIANKDYPGSRFGNVEKVVGAKDYHEGKADSIKGLEKIDDKTIKVTFEETYAPALSIIGGTGIVPKHIWEGVPVATWKEKKDLLSKPVGSGPYKVVTFNEGQDVQLEGFDEYYGGKPKTNKFIFKVTNEDTAQIELLNGTVDIVDVSNLKNQDLDEIKAKDKSIISYPNSMFQYMGFNLREEKFKDKNLRKAFMYAIDRKTMVDKLLEGRGTIVNTPMLTTSWAYPDEKTLNGYDYNVEEAKKLIKEAGYEDKNGNGIVEDKSGKELKATLYYPTGNKLREQTAPIIKESLKKIGVDIELESMEFQALMEKVVANHEFDLYLMANTPGSEPNPMAFWHSTSSSDEKGNSAWNISAFKNKEADKLIEDGLKTFDTEERKKIYGEFAKIMNDELPWVYLYDQDVTKATNSKLKNYKPIAHGDFIDVENWYIEE